jgi:hypothetical protein
VTTVNQLGPLSNLALSRDGASLYVLNADESAILRWNVSSQKVTGVTLRGAGINSLAILPDGHSLGIVVCARVRRRYPTAEPRNRTTEFHGWPNRRTYIRSQWDGAGRRESG